MLAKNLTLMEFLCIFHNIDRMKNKTSEANPNLESCDKLPRQRKRGEEQREWVTFLDGEIWNCEYTEGVKKMHTYFKKKKAVLKL